MEYDGVFEAIFKDGSSFKGGTLASPGWAKCPEEIFSLGVKLPFGDQIVIKDYEKFNFFIGATKNLNDGKVIVRHIFLLGLREAVVNSYRITLISPNNDKYKVGDITVRNFPYGKEGMGRTSTSGWKNGAK